MNGWGTTFLCISPDGTALPCQATAMLPDLTFPSVRTENIRKISVYWQLLLRNTTRSPTGVRRRLHAIHGSDHREAAVDRQDGAMQIPRVF